MSWRKMLLMLLFIIMPLFALADDPGEPCGGEDPYDEECPLDSWVYMLALTPVTVTFVGVFLRNEALKEDARNKAEDKKITSGDTPASIDKHEEAA